MKKCLHKNKTKRCKKAMHPKINELVNKLMGMVRENVCQHYVPPSKKTYRQSTWTIEMMWNDQMSDSDISSGVLHTPMRLCDACGKVFMDMMNVMKKNKI
jgi:hypothetical protein